MPCPFATRRDFLGRASAVAIAVALPLPAGRAAPSDFEGNLSAMKHKVKVTILDKKCYPELQRQYCKDPNAGPCPCYSVGDEFIFMRDEGRDDYWHLGLNTLVKTNGNPDTVAGGPKMPFCSELWDAISRYIYAGLQGGSIMEGWMAQENTMITCCNDGTRPVIVKIERIDYE